MHIGRKIGYKRVPVAIENFPQLENIDVVLDKVFIDEEPLSMPYRKVLTEMLNYVQEGDILIVESGNVLAGDYLSLFNILSTLKMKRVSIRFIDEKRKFEICGKGKEFNTYQELLHTDFENFGFYMAKGENEIRLEQEKFELEKRNGVQGESESVSLNAQDEAEDRRQAEDVKQMRPVHFKRKRHSNFTKEEIAKICKYSRMGLTAPVIAKMMDCKIVSVYRIWRNNGLSKKKIMEILNKSDPDFAKDDFGFHIDQFEQKQNSQEKKIPMQEKGFKSDWFLPPDAKNSAIDGLDKERAQ